MARTEECSFSLKHYEKTLADAKKKYSFYTFSELPKHKNEKNIIILRHDVDFDIRNAHKLAKIENALSIRATYFVRVNGKYNPFFHENYKLLKEIMAMGHEIALHVTEGYGELFGEGNTEVILRQKRILEAVLGKEIRGISTHEPRRTGQTITDDNLKEYGLEYQAYSGTFTKDMKYISESAGRWYEQCMCEFLKQPEMYPKLCILTHPIWWFDVSPVENY